MANKTVYPYGTEGRLPSSIGLVNDLITGGVDKALTAEQGKIIGEQLYYNSTPQEAAFGYDYPDANITPDSDYTVVGLQDSDATFSGRITKIKANFVTAGTAKFLVGRYDETHGYVDVESEFQEIIPSAGIQEISVSQPISAGNTLFVVISGGVSIKAVVNTGTKPSDWKAGIKSGDNGESYGRLGNVSFNLSWTIEGETLSGSVKDKTAQNSSNIAELQEDVADINVRVDTLENRPVIVKDENDIPYQITIVGGQIVAESLSYRKILVLSHSFGAMLPDAGGTSSWNRGMTSSSMTTDYPAQLNSVFNASMDRVKMIAWEQAFPSPSSTLPGLLDSHLSSDIDLVVIMLGANVPSSSQTRANAKANFKDLVNYCKNVASDATYVLCSPGYTAESNVFNLGIKDAADETSSIYCSTYSTDSDKYANFGDVVYDFTTSQYSFVVNSNGRANHPNDIWHLSMANAILSVLEYNTISRLYGITLNNQASADVHCYTRWVAGGRCTLVIYSNTAPTISVKDASNNTISGTLVNLSSQTWDNTPPKTPKFAYHFEMPNSEVTITIS